MTQIKPRKQRTTSTTEQKLDYAKLMVNIANKAVAFFRISLSLLARHSCFLSDCISCCSGVIALPLVGVV
jgi:hypothetical protein